MNSSYLNKDIEYGDLIKLLTTFLFPKKIIEFGILDGYSLDKFIEGSDKDTKIFSYDIFDEFNGNSPNKTIFKKFEKYSNVIIGYGDFYKKYKEIEDNSIDILHIDIANNGDVYRFAIENYMSKISENGIIILEGGSHKRDNIEWMVKYDKPKIRLVLEKIEHVTIGEFPSITIIKKQ